MAIYDSYFNSTFTAKTKEETERPNPNAAWGMRRRLKTLTNPTYECDVCGAPCDADDMITLDSGNYYVCSDDCADEASEIF